MSVINEYKDPMSGKVNNFAKGSIKFISIKPVKNPDADGVKRTHIPARNGQPAKVIEATHTISFLMQEVDDNNNVIDPQSSGQWISMGEKKLHANHTDKVQVKFDSGYKDILQGMVASFPLKVSKSGENTYYNGTLSGKTFNILDESKASASTPGQRAQQASVQAQAGAGTKIFGEILALEGNVAVVKDEKQGEGRVILSDEQLAEVSVGGRMGAFVDISTGNILNGFRAYGPAGQNNGGGSKRKSNYDPIGVETGHAINALAILLERGYKPKDELETAKLLHTVTVEVKKAEAERTSKDLDAVGASAGNAVLNGCRRADLKAKDLAAEIKKHAEIVLVTLAEPLYAFINTNGQPAQEKAPESAPEPQKSPNVVAAPPVDDFDEPPLDFDDDIPFAPIGLQYGRNFIHCI